ncbi:MAG: twin-arginine translocation signal domain-containing protein [Nitrospira sp.]|nr:MAG: twin-arginine translocation signal domain-containing protein [Nitrospira sp.]
MARTSAFRSFSRLMTAALLAERQGCSTDDAVGALQELTQAQTSARMSRRQFLLGAGATGATLAIGTITGFPLRMADAKPLPSSLSVGIVGAGLAGLACADTLKTRGIPATVYEAAVRAGGRCWSLRGFFPGQVAERGGELIDTLHKTILSYAKRFRLSLEDDHNQPGKIFYHFSGQRYSKSAIVAEFRDFVSVMRHDLNRLSPEVTASSYTPDDVTLDRTNLLAYLEGRNGVGVPAGPLAKAAIIAAYEAEYGLAAHEQSCLTFLLFIHADRRSQFTPFGLFGDERYHVVDGNDRIVEGLTRELPGQLTYDSRLVRVRKLSDGRIELTFRSSNRTVVHTHDVVVLTIPFTTLREVELDASLAIPSHQLTAIQELGYGTNAKMMIGFPSRPWRALGGNGTSYSDLTNHQTTWETNPTLGSETRGILTDFSSGARGAGLNPNAVQTEAQRFLTDLNKIFPGTLEAATRVNGQYLAHLEHWPSNPFMKGSYSCYRPGQFTTMAGLEGIPAGNLFFAGEHTNSFYEWQGFMEGAALSGIAAAKSILTTAKIR